MSKRGNILKIPLVTKMIIETFPMLMNIFFQNEPRTVYKLSNVYNRTSVNARKLNGNRNSYTCDTENIIKLMINTSKLGFFHLFWAKYIPKKTSGKWPINVGSILKLVCLSTM